MREKVYAYITRNKGLKSELLLFTQRNSPESGVQIPGGSLDTGEDKEVGILREVREETGLTDFASIHYLGELTHWSDYMQEEQKRYFFQLKYKLECPDTFEYEVQGGGVDEGLIFDYEWIQLEEVPILKDARDSMLHLLG